MLTGNKCEIQLFREAGRPINTRLQKRPTTVFNKREINKREGINIVGKFLFFNGEILNAGHSRPGINQR